MGLQGLWQETMDTLRADHRLGGAGPGHRDPAGHLGRHVGRVNAIVTPVLDFMQILPAFAYLAPLALVFLIGPAAAIVATWILPPPVIRLTAHGIRRVPATTREAVGLGGHRPQATARGVAADGQAHHRDRHQPDHMAALAMVTIAALIGAPGLGLVVTQALQTLDVGAAFNAGVCDRDHGDHLRPGHHRGQ